MAAYTLSHRTPATYNRVQSFCGLSGTFGSGIARYRKSDFEYCERGSCLIAAVRVRVRQVSKYANSISLIEGFFNFYQLLRKTYHHSNERENMKYLIFALLLVTILITAGCVGGNQNTGVTSDQTITTIPTSTPVPSQQAIQVSPSETADTLCGELVYCGYAPSGFKTQPIKSDRCTQLGDLRMQNDQKVMSCLKNPYAVSASNALEQEACAQGRITDLEYCEKIGVTFDKNGNYRINISKMNY